MQLLFTASHAYSSADTLSGACHCKFVYPVGCKKLRLTFEEKELLIYIYVDSLLSFRSRQ